MGGMNCPKCGAPRPDGAAECPQCGVIYARFEAAASKKRAADAEKLRAAQAARQAAEEAARQAQEPAAPAPSLPKRRGLVFCPTCKKQVSGNAEACPHCGEPIRENPHLVSAETSLGFKIAMVGVLAFAAGIGYLLWWGAHASPTAKIEAQRARELVIGENTVGCRNVEDFRALADMAAAKDYKAFTNRLKAHVATQTCIILPEGATAYREGYNSTHGADKIRIEGESGHWWVNAK